MIQYTPDRSATMQQGFGGETSARMCQYIEENPKGAVLLGLGVGFCAGLALASLLSGSSDYFSKEESLAEKISHRVSDSLANAVPSSWKNAFRS
jgi:hypothetical protein